MAAQREISWLAQLGGNIRLSVAIHNSTADFVGSNVADLNALIRPFGPLIGLDFDIGYATAELPRGAAGMPEWGWRLRRNWIVILAV